MVIDLCLVLLPWAAFRKAEGAVKMHTHLDLRGNIPCVVIVTTGKVHEVKILDELPMEGGGVYIMDRGHLDFACLHQAGAFFLSRVKDNTRTRRLLSRAVDK